MANRREPARWCGNAALGPEATMVSNAGRSYPAARSAASMTPATSRSSTPGATASNAASATVPRPAAARRRQPISNASFTARRASTSRSVGRSVSAFVPSRLAHPACVATLTCCASKPIATASSTASRSTRASS